MSATIFEISGNTYPYAKDLRALGMEWDAERKVWLTADKAAADKAVNPTYMGRRAPKDLRVQIVEA